MSVVTMSMGGGGRSMEKFIKEVVLKHFGNEILSKMTDAAKIDIENGKGVFTTDSFVVKPEFFPGGDIGKIAVCGTVNDIAVSGGRPKYLSFGLIVPEGYCMEKLERIIESAGKTCREAGVQIVCGDTKVVEKGGIDAPIINCSGVGELVADWNDYSNIEEGDGVIITSDIARHGISILLARGELGFDGDIKSDCAPLNNMLAGLHDFDVKFCRDATRGGVAAVLNEISEMSGIGFEIDENDIPLAENVEFMCEMLGFDPLTVANEGVAVIIARSNDCLKIKEILCNNEYGVRASICGSVTNDKRVVINTITGGKRNVGMPSGELLPRIC